MCLGLPIFHPFWWNKTRGDVGGVCVCVCVCVGMDVGAKEVGEVDAHTDSPGDQKSPCFRYSCMASI